MLKKFMIGFVLLLALILISATYLFANNLDLQSESKTKNLSQENQQPAATLEKTQSIIGKSLFNNFFGGKLKVSFDIKILSDDEENNFKEEIERSEKNLQILNVKADAERQVSERQSALKRVDENAPDEFKNIVYGVRIQDLLLAEQAADEFVDYMINLMFEVRQISDLIGKAMIKREIINEEDMIGVSQYIDINFAEARANNFMPLKPTHKEAMKRITPDPKHEADVYYFFTLSCNYCRYMAGDVERLWRVVSADSKKLKMVALTLAKEEPSWINSYRDYTDMTLPIEEGSELAKSFGIGFVPALVVVSPNNNQAYIKSGQQDFVRMYEFVRTVQGLPAEITPEIANLMREPIGQFEKQDGGKGMIVADGTKESRKL
ncbi:MAG: hypothetical protein LBE20_02385 [Deltaproteobacteria bacterium]|jgi:thiol-disulfide isomerase/thioredoxin|nr:hypothetical protein [Deltaproteobacteria bacterium]